MRDSISQLKNLKTNSVAGWVSDAQRAEKRSQLMEAIGSREALIETTLPVYTKWVFADFISKPLAAGVVVFVLLLGGWMTTVSAASNSLPGDTLYQVKLVTEAAQLKLASSDRKAILHTEFAENRLNEAVSLSGSNASEQTVASAMSAFKSEISLAEGAVKKMQEDGHSQTVAVAYKVDQKISALSNTLEVSRATENNTINVQDAERTTKDASDSVVDVMVTTHESSGTAATTISLDSRFRDGVSAIHSRQTFDLGRIAVIKSALADPALAAATGITLDKVNSVEFSTTHSTERVPEAMDLMAQGGVRAAFDILINVNQSLSNAESTITEFEIQISVAASSLKEPVVEEAPNEEFNLIINARDETP
ncbi:MAG: DUF5667 domain-containing protein [Patescibacteria group bacterium]